MWTFVRTTLSLAVLQLAVVLAVAAATSGFYGVEYARALLLGGGCVVMGTLACWLVGPRQAATTARRALGWHLYSQGAKWLTTLLTFFLAMSSVSAESARPLLLGYIMALITHVFILPVTDKRKTHDLH